MRFPAKYRPVLTVPLVWLSGCGLGPLSQIAERDPIISLTPPDPLVALERSSQSIEAELEQGGMFTADLRNSTGGADADRLMQLTRSRKRMQAALEDLEELEADSGEAVADFAPPSRRSARGPALDASDPTLPPSRRASRGAAAPAPAPQAVAAQAAMPPYASRQARQARQARQNRMEIDGASMAEAERIDRAVAAQAERAELAAITEAELIERRLEAEAQLIERLARAETELAERVALAKEERDRRIEVARQERELRMAIAGISSESILDSSKLDRARAQLESEAVAAATESRWSKFTRMFRREPELLQEKSLTGEEVLAAIPRSNSAKAVELQREKEALERAIAALRADDADGSTPKTASLDELLKRSDETTPDRSTSIGDSLLADSAAPEMETPKARGERENLHPSLLDIPDSAWADAEPSLASADEDAANGPREMPLFDFGGPSLLDDAPEVADSGFVPPAPSGGEPEETASPSDNAWLLERNRQTPSLFADSDSALRESELFPDSNAPRTFPESPKDKAATSVAGVTGGPSLGLLPPSEASLFDEAEPRPLPGNADNPWATAQPLVADGNPDPAELPQVDWSNAAPRIEPSLAPVTHQRGPTAREELHSAAFEQQSLLDVCGELPPELQQLVLQLDIPEAGVRKAVLADLASLGRFAEPALPAVKVLLEDAPLVAAHAAWAISEIRPEDQSAQQELLRLMQTRDAEVVQFAAYALGSMGPAALPSAPALRVERERHSGETRLHIAEALTRIDAFDTASVEVLINALSNTDQQYRWLAAIALGAVNDRHAASAIPALTASLRDTDPEVRSAAALSLGGFGAAAAAAIPELENRAATDAPAVQEAARTALACIRE